MTTRAYDEGKQVDTLYMDIQKAFDTVLHRRLLQVRKNTEYPVILLFGLNTS